ncbi:MAG: hypothetical protein ACOCP8_06150 [archaeon]
MKDWSKKEKLPIDETLKDHENDNKFIYFKDKTCVEITQKFIFYYKLENPYSYEIPIYNWKKILHREDGPAVETIDGYKYYIKDEKLYYIENKEEKIYIDNYNISNDYYNNYITKDFYNFFPYVKIINGKPSYISYYDNGNVKSEYFFKKCKKSDLKYYYYVKEYSLDGLLKEVEYNDGLTISKISKIKDIKSNKLIQISRVFKDYKKTEYIKEIRTYYNLYFTKNYNIEIKNNKRTYFKGNKKINRLIFNLNNLSKINKINKIIK